MKWSAPKTRKMRAALAAGTFAGLYGFAALSTQIYIRAFLLPKIQSLSLELNKAEPRILADLKLLKEKPVYPDQPREKNAERFLSGFMSWTAASLPTIDNADHDRLIAVMKDHEHAVQSDQEWQNFLDDERLDEMNLTWIDQLMAYDHIDFGSHPVYADLLSRVLHSHGVARLGIAANLPFPEMRELRFAALARVAQLQLEDRLMEAPGLYRHVGFLLSTTDSLSGSMMSVYMLQSEKNLAQRTGARWPQIEEDRIQAMKRTAWAWGGIEQIFASQGSLGIYEPYFHRSANACAGLLEMSGGAELLQNYLSPTVPLEYDLSERLSKETEFKRRLFSKCDHENLEVFLTPIADEDSPLMLGHIAPNPARIPFYRRLLGLQLMAWSVPNYFGLYQETPRRPASK